MSEPISREEWEKALEQSELRYVHYQYHKDVCAKSIERAKTIESLESRLAEASKPLNNAIMFYEKWMADYPDSKTGPVLKTSGVLAYLKKLREKHYYDNYKNNKEKKNGKGMGV